MKRELEKLLEAANKWDPSYIYALPTSYKRNRNKNATASDLNENISLTTNSSNHDKTNEIDTRNEDYKKNGNGTLPLNKRTRTLKTVKTLGEKNTKKRDKKNLVNGKTFHEKDHRIIRRDGKDTKQKANRKKITTTNNTNLETSNSNTKKRRLSHSQFTAVDYTSMTDIDGSTVSPDSNVSINDDDDTTTFLNNSGTKKKGYNRNRNKRHDNTKKKSIEAKKSTITSISDIETDSTIASPHSSPNFSDADLSNSDSSNNPNYFESIKTFFIEQETKIINLNYSFFNFNLNTFDLNSIKIFPSNNLSSLDHSSSKESSKWVNLNNILFHNFSESYEVNFQKERVKYDPMLEIGKLIEYFILIYLPNDYWQRKLTNEILIPLNKAYDNNDQLTFIQTIKNYNNVISNIPRSLIKLHLSEKKTLPQSFIHDFLQIIYCRSIHPHANKLKNYQAFSNFVYGELLPNFLSDVFNKCSLNKDSIFIDLGSGVGNCVIQASLEFGCKLSAGCEIMNNASELTEIQLNELNNRCKLMGINVSPIEFILRQSFVGNERVIELLKKCDVLLINNFLFDSKLNEEVEKLIQNCKIGCKIITLKNLRRWGYTIDFYNVDNVLSRMKIEKFTFKQDSVSWTHNGGEYFISTILPSLDESLLHQESRFRRSDRNVRYSR